MSGTIRAYATLNQSLREENKALRQKLDTLAHFCKYTQDAAIKLVTAKALVEVQLELARDELKATKAALPPQPPRRSQRLKRKQPSS